MKEFFRLMHDYIDAKYYPWRTQYSISDVMEACEHLKIDYDRVAEEAERRHADGEF